MYIANRVKYMVTTTWLWRFTCLIFVVTFSFVLLLLLITYANLLAIFQIC